MSLGSITQYARELAEPVKGFVQTVADPSKYLDKIRAYGDTDGATGLYFCNPDRLNIEKKQYIKDVEQINLKEEAFKLQYPNAGPDEIGDLLVRQVGAQQINPKARCLAETHGVDPDSVAQFTPEVKEAFSYNLEALSTVAPDLVDYADVPFTGDPMLDVMIAGSIVAGTTVGLTKFRGKFGNLFYNYKV